MISGSNQQLQQQLESLIVTAGEFQKSGREGTLEEQYARKLF